MAATSASWAVKEGGGSDSGHGVLARVKVRLY